jgi:leucyl aminopeptidase
LTLQGRLFLGGEIMNKLTSALIAVAVLMSTSAFAHQPGEAQSFFSKKELAEKRLIDTGNGKPKWMTLAQALHLGEEAHKAGRCGGFFDLTDMKKVSSVPLLPVEAFRLSLSDRPITQQAYLSESLSILDTQRLFKTVGELSAFKNRFYKSETGVKAAEYIADQFRALGKNRTDVSVNLYKHKKWLQPSVIASIKGTGPQADEIVVIGGHEDSINQSGFGSPNMTAPGADDNASGVATVLEVFRVLVETNFKPNRTLMFMTYAGEEAGLLGSQEIANEFKLSKKAVVAVVQFDMTGFVGAGDQVVFMTDFTNPDLTQFSQKLLDTYVKVKWSTDKCGYACSDHASWNKAGYMSVMPFESTMDGMNHDIHSAKDLINKIDFKHGLHFAKLGLAFMAELSQ